MYSIESCLTRDPSRMVVTFTYEHEYQPGEKIDDEGQEVVFEEVSVDFPAKWVVCHGCQGRGTETLRDFAFTAEDFEQDPDFADDYRSGKYDQPCRDCHGRSTTLEIDIERAQSMPEWATYLEWERDYAESEATYQAERRAGA